MTSSGRSRGPDAVRSRREAPVRFRHPTPVALLLALAACTYDPRPLPDLVITLTVYCESMGCASAWHPPRCTTEGLCHCGADACYVPSCEYPDDDPSYQSASLTFTDAGTPCLHDRVFVP